MLLEAIRKKLPDVLARPDLEMVAPATLRDIPNSA